MDVLPSTSVPVTVPRARRPEFADLVLSGCLAAISLLAAAVAAGRDDPGNAAPDTWWQWIVIIVPSVAVAFRRSAPLTATPVAVLGQLLIWALGLAEVFVAPLVMIYSVAAEGGHRGRVVGVSSSLALSAMAAVGVWAAPDVSIDVFALTVLSCVAVLVLGVNAATQRERAAVLAAELAVARIERDAESERAVAGERQRIARELHDLVGHSLSVIAVRAEAAERVAVKQPSAALEAISAIGSTARSSLDEVRRVLFGLRHDDARVELAPLPVLDDIGPLVDTAASAGLDVAYRVSGEVSSSVSPTVGAGAYRIVQEALTNVIKHAGPGAHAVVDVDVADGDLRLVITDDGRGAAALRPDGRAGSGIAGMAERAVVLGGSLEAGPQPGGGFQVAASLPITSIHEGDR